MVNKRFLTKINVRRPSTCHTEITVLAFVAPNPRESYKLFITFVAQERLLVVQHALQQTLVDIQVTMREFVNSEHESVLIKTLVTIFRRYCTRRTQVNVTDSTSTSTR